ncbi:unnamed protein product [Caretta caretta]
MPHRPIDLQVICVSAGNQDHRSQAGRNIHRPLWFSCCVCECQSLEPNHKQTPSVVSRCRRGTSPTEQCWGNIPASEAEMGMQIVWYVSICFMAARCSGGQINQTQSLVLEKGHQAQLICKQTYGHNNMFWYRQDPGQDLQLLFLFVHEELTDKGNVTDRFQAKKLQPELLSLNISPVKPEDSAVYFCASRANGGDNDNRSRLCVLIEEPYKCQCWGTPLKMEMQIVWCMAICLLGAKGADVHLNQTLSLVLERGKIADLHCEQNINHDYMYWYQQHQGKGLHLIYYSYDTAQVEPGNISERFTAVRPQTQLFQLKISSVKPEDSAVYFCSSSLDTVLQSHLLPLQKTTSPS